MEWAAWVAWEEWAAWVCNPITPNQNSKRAGFYCPFFLLKKICNIKLLLCRKDIVENHLKTLVSKKNLSLVSKKKGNLNEKSEKILNLFKPSVVFFKFSKAIKYV